MSGHEGAGTSSSTSQPKRTASTAGVVAVLLGLALAVSVGFAWFQHRSVQQLTSARNQLAESLGQTKAQVDSMSEQLKVLASAARQAERAPAVSPAAAKPVPKAENRRSIQSARAARRPAEDPRWKKVDSELAQTRSDLAQTRSDLENNLKSSHDELSQSIARTNDELAELQKKGEYDYFQFDLGKSKQFSRTGPIGISLRKADTKHDYCDLMVRVEDDQLGKKHVNLFEPVFFYPEGYSQPIELVVNRIDKNHIKGYVRKPKYGPTQAASTDSRRLEISSGAGATTQPEKPAPVLPH